MSQTNTPATTGTVPVMVGPDVTVRFSAPGPRHAVEWEVAQTENGSLIVFACGRRCGRVLIEPSSNQYVRVTTTSILEAANKSSTGPEARQ